MRPLPGPVPVLFADPFGEPVGSNNWAVSGKKTKSGFPILCDDPHLQLTLPSIWYEVQLSAPGLNVRGVSLPGAPGVVIGFNEKIAWGVTNAGSDVLDFYQLRFRDQQRREYAWGETWRPLTWRREEVRVRGGKTVVENVPYTHLGPVPFATSRPGMPDWIPDGAAMRWTGHDASTILDALYRLNRARGYEDFKAAIAGFDCPAQNFAYAGSDGRIAIWHNGKFPLRARGQGRYLLDGSDPQSEWAGWVPMDRVPAMEDPERGFVSSANQSPTDDAYPYYLGWDYGTFERGRRINELLEAATAISGADMVAHAGRCPEPARPHHPAPAAGDPENGPLTAGERARVGGLWRAGISCTVPKARSPRFSAASLSSCTTRSGTMSCSRSENSSWRRKRTSPWRSS